MHMGISASGTQYCLERHVNNVFCFSIKWMMTINQKCCFQNLGKEKKPLLMYDTSFMVPSVIHTDRVKNRRLWVREHCLNLRKSENHYRVDSRQSRTHFQERKMNLRYISFETTEPVDTIRREEKGNGNNSLMVFLVATSQDFRVGFYFYFENSIKNTIFQ